MNAPPDPAAATYYPQPPSQQPAGEWGPPSAGYSPQTRREVPGAIPPYNERGERVPAYGGYPGVHQDEKMSEKTPFEDVKV